MPSERHEEIVDDVREAINRLYITQYPELGMTIEAIVANLFMGLTGKISERADGYIWACDGAGPILLEVERMAPDKWQRHRVEDGGPPRVLRIGFNGSIGILNPRGTALENDLIDTISSVMQSIEQPGA